MFHAALIVFAAIQIHETRVALVRRPNCDGTVSYVVCFIVSHFTALRTHLVPLKTCGGTGTLYKRVEHLLFAVPGIIAAAWIIMIFFVRALYYEFG